MSDPQTHEPLIGASSQAAINVGVPAVSGSSTRAYKVAGLTVLACLLIAGQALTVYAVLNQRNDIKALELKHKEMKNDLRNVRVAAAPVKFQLPMMNNFPMLTDFLDEGESTAAPEDGTLAEQATKCQLEAAGLKSVAGTSFRPRCDEQGHYQAQQCWKGRCWCVEPSSGDAIPYSLRTGPAACGRSGDGLSSVGLERVMDLPVQNVEVMEE